VALFLDVRGFSTFAKIAESSETALFLRSAYERILDDYFPSASFFKPTGDGLMVILDYDAENLTTVVNGAVSSSLKLVKDFPTITANDPMINFPVPEKLGIGIARGAATALISGDQVLDYSGRSLNIAARLMDLARPHGVVVSETLGIKLLDEEYREQLNQELVYIKGIADEEPIAVYTMFGWVDIPAMNRKPLTVYEWRRIEQEKTTIKSLKSRGSPSLMAALPAEPALPDDIRVYAVYPAPTASGRKHPKYTKQPIFKATYNLHKGGHYARINIGEIAARLEQDGAKPLWPITLTVEYAVHPESGPRLT
jgi:class 3 adenylate cyclase